MKILQKILCSIATLFVLTTPAFAYGPSHFGVTIPVVLISHDPDYTHAYRGVIWYQPKITNWGIYNIYFAANYGHWWSDADRPNSTINIYAIAPVFHLFLARTDHFSPYFEASIGPAYMSGTRFGGRNLGMHYTFQDEFTIGALFGKDHGFYAAWSALHYSNGSICAHNSGITVPVILNLGYEFA